MASEQSERNRTRQWKRINEMKIAWNAHTLYTAGATNELVRETDIYKTNICALQEIRLPGEGSDKKYMTLYSGH